MLEQAFEVLEHLVLEQGKEVLEQGWNTYSMKRPKIAIRSGPNPFLSNI